MKRRVIVLITAAVLVPALLIWLLWANSSPASTQVTVASGALPEAFEGFKIAHVSDLHNAVFGRKNEKLLSLIRAAEPDIIAITGDLIDSRHTDIDSALAFVEAAAEIAPVYYVTGNHESRLDFDEIEPRLIAAGARVLRNEAEYIEHGGERIRLAGIDDPSFIRTGGTAEERAAAELEQLGDGGGTFTVLLAHRPELVEVYAEYGAGLVLSGHAHGGQVRLPLLGGLYAPGQGLLPEYDSGLYSLGETQMVVSRGLGNSVAPLRVNNRPELVIVTLSR
ncbi:MAG: metallophosphoesterase [Oscillospiraceae bacterium]